MPDIEKEKENTLQEATMLIDGGSFLKETRALNAWKKRLWWFVQTIWVTFKLKCLTITSTPTVNRYGL